MTLLYLYLIIKGLKMRRYTLTIGLFDKDTKKQKFSHALARNIVSQLITETIGYGTIYNGDGIYTHVNGEVVVEPSIVFFVDGEKDLKDKVKTLAWQIKKALNQESVMLEETAVKMEFI